MFVARYENTMRNAKFAPPAAPKNVRTIEQIRAENRRKRAEEAARLAEELARAQAEAKRNLDAIASYRCIDVLGHRPKSRDIIRMVALANGITVEDILGLSRDRRIVQARFDAIKAVADARPDLSTVQIGKIFGRDHSSIVNALRQRGGRSLQHREG
jgi:chromosomal replication initiator protein